jgi:hypothetical protein
MTRMAKCASLLAALASLLAAGPGPKQPKVNPGPGEPDWVVILDTRYGLKMFDDLQNPVVTTAAEAPGLFRKAGPGPVRFSPVIALGLETATRGGWYEPGSDAAHPNKHDLWSYQFKNTAHDLETNEHLPPPLQAGSKTEFDPGDRPFGLCIANDGFQDGGVFTEPKAVAAVNARLAAQPYKTMIYRNRDKATGQVIPHSYLIGWEYSTNDDFQDVVTRVDNVELIPTAKP